MSYAAGPTPAQVCNFGGADFLSSGENQNGYSVDVVARELPKLLGACSDAVGAGPKSAALHARYGRVLAISGDRAGALKQAQLGAELGSSMAMVLLGVMQAEGDGVARDYGAALKLFREAEKKGHPLASFNLAIMTANGWGVAADDSDANTSLNRAAARYDPLAMQILGDAYAKGRGVTADSAEAERWWKKAGERPVALPVARREPLRLSRLGRLMPDTAAIVSFYERQARAGEPWAQNYLGHLYEAGQWVAQDYSMAQTWYRRAAESDYGPALQSMAMLYQYGLGVEADPDKAREWMMAGVNRACDRAVQADPGANACDRLAADASDPAKVVPGLNAWCMHRYAEPAIPACRQATKEFPSVVRFRAQLARALAHAGRFDEARREAQFAQAKGSTLAMTLLGAMDEFGYGGPKNPAAALAWYRKAAELDDDRAIKLVGMKAMSGVGIDKDSAEAKALIAQMQERQWKHFHAAGATPATTAESQAEKGDPAAQHNLAFRFEQQKRYDEAIRWYRLAAAQGYEPSVNNLAQMYEKGIGVEKDFAEAKKWYRKSMERGSGEARYRLADLDDRTGDLAEAIALYRKSASQDDWRAMIALGLLHEQGRGVKKDEAEALALYEKAGDRSRWAQFKIGAMYLQGSGTAKNPAKALQWWQKSADGGNARAQNNLGVMYDRGIAVQRDFARARDWYLLAVNGGVPEAKGNLEDFFEQGRGAPADPAAAVAWYRSGAEAGIASAQYRLGDFYANGLGVARDERQAIKWLSAAMEQGYPKAAPALAEMYFALGQRYEEGDGVAKDQNAATQAYAQAATLGHKRALNRLIELRTQAGDAAGAAQLKAFFMQPPRLPSPPKWPTGFNLDSGKDEQREMQIRVAGAGQMESASVSADAFTVILWIPPRPAKAQ